MSALILRGAEVAQKIKDEVRTYTEENPGINLTIFQVGDNPVTLGTYEWTLFEFTPDETGEYLRIVGWTAV